MFTDLLCSPEDHATLEAEYERNPKPDKAARMEIVNRVALGEKEVQVSRGCHWIRTRPPTQLSFRVDCR